MPDSIDEISLTDNRLRDAIQFATGMVGKRPTDADLRDYLRGTIDPRKFAWCTAFLNATLKHAGIEGTPSMMATSFLSWGKHISKEQARAGDIVVTGRGSRQIPRPGGEGHAAILTGPVYEIEGTRGKVLIAPTISGDWTDQVKEAQVPFFDGTAEFRRAPPSHSSRQHLFERSSGDDIIGKMVVTRGR